MSLRINNQHRRYLIKIKIFIESYFYWKIIRVDFVSWFFQKEILLIFTYLFLLFYLFIVTSSFRDLQSYNISDWIPIHNLFPFVIVILSVKTRIKIYKDYLRSQILLFTNMKPIDIRQNFWQYQIYTRKKKK